MDLEAYREQGRRTWDGVATGWEARRDFLERNVGVVSDWIIGHIEPRPGQVVLDVAAGPGDLGHRIAPLVGPSGRVVSTDFASEMVEVARRLGAAGALGNVEYRQLDAERMSLDDDAVDAVVCRFGYMLMADPAAALREARRVLRPDGVLAFTVFTTPERNLWAAVPGAALVLGGHLSPPQPDDPGVFTLGDPERLRDLVTGAGFSDPVVESIDFGFHYVDEDDAWAAVVDLTGPLASVIEGLPDPERERVRTAVVDGFATCRNPDGSYDVPAQAWAVHAS